MRINVLLTICLINCLFPLYIAANSVSGLYNIPHHSVKFEKQSNFSILPVGWSKDGKAAFLIEDNEKSTLNLIIVDALDDKVLWKSPFYSTENKSMGRVWNDHADLFSTRLAGSSIIPDENPHYGSPVFSFEEDDFKIYVESTTLTGSPGLASVSLKIESKLRGIKTLYNYVHNDSGGMPLMEFPILGYFKSPWEKRVAVLSVQDFLSDKGEETKDLKFSGAHLSIGYKREISSETELVDSVISGQYYNARTLLIDGTDPNINVPSGESLLIMAARQNNWDLVFLLIDYNASLAVIDSEKRTLLHYGVIHGNADVVRKLLMMGINKNFKDSEGETALSLAGKKGFGEIVRLLGD